MIGIFAGNSSDVSTLISMANVQSTFTVGQMKAYICKKGTKQFAIIVTGYGKVNVGFAYAIAKERLTIDEIIVVGNCGCISRDDAGIGDIAISNSSFQFDVDCMPLGYKIHQIPEIVRHLFIADKALVTLAMDKADTLGYQGFEAKYGTADKFLASNKTAENLRFYFDTDCVDMECACFGELAYIFSKPYVCVKGVSNCGDNCAATECYKNNAMANAKSNKVVYDMINSLLTDTEDEENTENAADTSDEDKVSKDTADTSDEDKVSKDTADTSETKNENTDINDYTTADESEEAGGPEIVATS